MGVSPLVLRHHLDRAKLRNFLIFDTNLILMTESLAMIATSADRAAVAVLAEIRAADAVVSRLVDVIEVIST